MVSSIAFYCLHKVKLFQVLLFIVCTYLYGFKYSKWSNSSIWPIDEISTGTTTLGQSGLKSNDNEGVFHIPQSSWTEASSSEGLVS